MDWPRRERATTATPAREGITRCWPLPPAPAKCARAGPTPPAAPPTSSGDGGAGALRRGYSTAHGAGRQRLLWPHCRFRLPGNGCPLLHHRPPARQPAGIEAIPEELDSHSVLDGRCCRDDLHPVPDQRTPPVLIVRRVKPSPGSQLALLARYSYTALDTDRDGGTLELEADHRRHAEVENAIRDLKYGVGLN